MIQSSITPAFLDAILSSLFILSVTFILIVPLAYFNSKNLTKYDFKLNSLFEGLTLAMMVVPAYVYAVIYREFFSITGPLQHILSPELLYPLGQVQIQSSIGFSFCIALSLYPIIFSLFQVQQKSHLMMNRVVGQNLNLSSTSEFIQITFPYFKPVFFFTAVLIFSFLIGDYTTAQILGVRTLSTFLYNSWFTAYEQMDLVRMSVVVVGIIFALLGLFIIHTFKKQRTALKLTIPHQKVHLPKNKYGIVFAPLAAPLICGFFIPSLILARWIFERIASIKLDRFFEIVFESFIISGTVTVLIILLCVLLILFFRQKNNSKVIESALIFLSTGYLIPSLSLAFLILWAFGGTVSEWDVKYPILIQLSGLIKFLGPAVFIFLLRNQQIHLTYDWTLKMLNVPVLKKLTLFIYPYFKTTLWMTLSFIFIESLKEIIFPLTLRSFTYSTLSVESYVLISNNYFKESSILILSLMICSIYPILIFIRNIKTQIHEDDIV